MMDDWPPDRNEIEDEDGRPATDDPHDRRRDRFSEAVGDAWESGQWGARDPFDDPG